MSNAYVPSAFTHNGINYAAGKITIADPALAAKLAAEGLIYLQTPSTLAHQAQHIQFGLTNPASFSTDASNNNLALQTPTGNVRSIGAARSNILTRSLTGMLQASTTTNNYTHHVQTQLAARPTAIRFGFPSLDANATPPVISACFGFGAIVGAYGSTVSKGGDVAMTTGTTSFIDNGAGNGTPSGVSGNILTILSFTAGSGVQPGQVISGTGVAGSPFILPFTATTPYPGTTGTGGLGTYALQLTSGLAAGFNITATALSTNAYNPVTFGGAATGTPPVNSNGAARPTWLWSDWMQAPGATLPADGTAYPILHMNILESSTSGNQTWCANPYYPSATTEDASLGGTGNVNRTWRGYRASGNFVSSNQGGITAAAANEGAFRAVVVQYMCLETGVTLCTFGDSIYNDAAANYVTSMISNCWGHTNICAEALHSSNIPVEVCNLGWSAQTSATYLLRFQDVAQYIGSPILLYGAGSPNDNAGLWTPVSVAAEIGQFGLVQQLAAQYKMTLVTQSITPRNAPTANGGTGGTNAYNVATHDANRLSLNAYLMSTQGYHFDAAAVLSNPAGAVSNGQIEYNCTTTPTAWGIPPFTDIVHDGEHPNDAGQSAWGLALAAYLRPII